ncbi:MAG TPA: SRPBCC family protein [Candidatus Lokiarchaeia archaeon]|nr:SRPBCC family protein [Candidatus Lokiarchaeia archaeon]
MPVEHKTLEQRVTINASPHDVYEAYMDAEKHIAFTGDHARIDPHEGGTFTTYNGSINGKFLELVPDEKIVEEWQADEEGWPKGHFSIVTILLTPTDEGTQLDLSQEKLPKQCAAAITQGWKNYYWDPLNAYFEKGGHHTMKPVEGEEDEETAGKPPITGHVGARLKKEHTKSRVREDDQLKAKRRERGIDRNIHSRSS